MNVELVTSGDILVIIPTHGHPKSLPLAVESARRQTVTDIDIVVIGDGVEDETRDAMAPILSDDDRVHFLDLPKAARHGEKYRDAVIRQSSASLISYLCDDDLLFPHHVETMRNCIAGVDFANPLPILLGRDGRLYYLATDLSVPGSLAWHLHPRLHHNSVSLTGATHTRESYLRLPHGWRPAPAGRWSDHYMWEQYFQLDGFTARTSSLATTVKFLRETRADMTDAQIASETRACIADMSAAGFTERWNTEVAEQVRRTSVQSHVRIAELEELMYELEQLLYKHRPDHG